MKRPIDDFLIFVAVWSRIDDRFAEASASELSCIPTFWVALWAFKSPNLLLLSPPDAQRTSVFLLKIVYLLRCV